MTAGVRASWPPIDVAKALLETLVPWLREQITEDRRIAQEACDGPWNVNDAGYAEAIHAADGTCVIGGGRWGGEAGVFDSTEDALHIVRHDPRAVLAQCDAHDRLVDYFVHMYELWEKEGEDEKERGYRMMSQQLGDAGFIMRQLALAYQHRPGYREKWRLR